jgi:predicted RecB family nuclease
MKLQTFCSTCMIALAAALTTARCLADAGSPAPSPEERLRQGETDRAKLQQQGIRTIRDLAQAQKSRLASVVGPTRADSLIAAARHFTEPASVVDPGCVLDPEFIVNPDFLIDPDLKTDDATRGKLAAAAAQVRRLDGLGIRTYAEIANPTWKARLESVVGVAKAAELAQRVRSAGAAGILDPDLLVHPAFLVDSRIVMRGLR